MSPLHKNITITCYSDNKFVLYYLRLASAVTQFLKYVKEKTMHSLPHNVE